MRNLNRIASVIALTAGALSTTGCLVSLQPFYTTSTMVDEPAVAGRWTDGDTVWTVDRTAPSRYLIREEGSGSSDLEAVLFNAGGMLFLDYQEKRGQIFDSAIHAHGLLRLDLRGDAIDAAPLEGDQLNQMVQSGILDTDYADMDPGVLLTAKPHLLQSFVIRHAGEAKFFSETVRLRRVR